MDRFVIEGPTRLEGELAVGGAKNAVLPLMAAALLGRGTTVIENVPDLHDVRFFMTILEGLGATCSLVGSELRINTAEAEGREASYDLVRKMRASIYVLGPLLAFQGEARVSLPGGCAWGPRPVNLHLEGLAALGAEIALDRGYIHARVPRGGLHGGRFRFEPVSVGGTCNVLMAAVLARGETVLENCAIEPEVTQLAIGLRDAGALIEGIGTATLRIQGPVTLRPLQQSVIADRIEAGTFMAGVALAGGRVRLTGVDTTHVGPITAVLREMGCDITEDGDTLTIAADGRPVATEIITRPYPGFPTDMQAQLMAVCAVADGTSFISEGIYADRFTHVAEMQRLGADIRVDGARATIFGVEKLQGAPVMASDLRASAALVLAGVAAEGTTTVNRVYHIDRGYERIEQRLAVLGARIERVSS
ncbi:MAG: UDP-N-acetylglucosamine 1-carboxyvinyltransferase [bacterium]|jgi:UDP-N-acetylglucosamine 1-carboxyvinyltransferase|nr:UDP-N-acetylglucosamine 1-carboxyvinyltransferase [bacterium]